MTTAEGSVAFDRAADYYDRTRALPEATVRATVDLLAGELAGHGRALEIGVGTGRIALPLHRAGASMAGVDLSAPMLQRLGHNAGGTAPFPIAVADATRLPFADHTFGAGIACHVLHLVADWELAIDELLRVVRPAGVLLVDPGGGWPTEHGQITTRFQQEARAQAALPGVGAAADRTLAGLGRAADLDAAIDARDGRLRLLPVVANPSTKTLSAVIGEMEAGQRSWNWQLSPADLRRAGERVRTWAQDRWGDLDAERELAGEIQWRAYDLPA
jgi:ubiquinone/menaquinone biosynthesis C-methylase UbiE